MSDHSYTPLKNEFDRALKSNFGDMSLTDRQVASLEAMFFAGASVALGIVSKNADRTETVRAELLDYADRVE